MMQNIVKLTELSFFFSRFHLMCTGFCLLSLFPVVLCYDRLKIEMQPNFLFVYLLPLANDAYYFQWNKNCLITDD